MKPRLFFLLAYFFPLVAAANPFTEQSFASTLVILLAIIALILGIAKVIKGLQLPATGAKGEITLLAQMPLGQKERILLLQVNNEQLLVGVTQQQIQLIKTLNPPSFNCSQTEELTGEAKNHAENTEV